MSAPTCGGCGAPPGPARVIVEGVLFCPTCAARAWDMTARLLAGKPDGIRSVSFTPDDENDKRVALRVLQQKVNGVPLRALPCPDRLDDRTPCGHEGVFRWYHLYNLQTDQLTGFWDVGIIDEGTR